MVRGLRDTYPAGGMVGSPDGDGNTPDGNRPLVLVVGAGVLCDGLISALPQYGVRSQSVYDISETVAVIEQSHPAACVVEVPRTDVDTPNAIGRVGMEGAVPVLAVSRNDSDGGVERILQAGARGYITDRSSVSELFGALCRVVAGEIAVEFPPPAGSNYRNAGHDSDATEAQSVRRLTFRERQCVQRLLGSGSTRRVIAESLDITTHTLRTHLYNAYAKLGVGSERELAAFMLRQGVWQCASDGSRWRWPE